MDRVREVLESNFSNSKGTNMCQIMEEKFAEKVGAKYGIAFGSGTATLHACLGALGIGPGDEVIVPALNVLHTAAAVLYQNAVPVFADSKEDTFNIDPESIENRITPQTKAIIPVSLYGLPVNFDRIQEIADEHDLYIIADNAEAHGAIYKEKKIGGITEMASYSLEASKHIAIGDGGIVTTNDLDYANKLRAFCFLGYDVMSAQTGDARSGRDLFQDPNYKRHVSFGFSYKLPEVSCAIAISQIEKYEKLIQLRCDIAKLFDEAIEDCEWMIPQYNPKGRVNSYWTYAVKFEGGDWKKFRKEYMKNGGDGIYAAWTPTYLEPVFQKGVFYGKGCPIKCPLYKGEVEYKKGLCPTTEKIQPKIMQFCTNYGNLEEAKEKTDALKKTIKEWNKNI